MAIKGLAAAIAPKVKEVTIEEKEPAKGGAGKLAACEDIISAIKRGDAKALGAALDDWGAMNAVPEDQGGEEIDF